MVRVEWWDGSHGGCDVWNGGVLGSWQRSGIVGGSLYLIGIRVGEVN